MVLKSEFNGGNIMNKYLVAIRHFFDGYRTFEIDADDKSDALIKGREYVRRIGGGNYDINDAKIIKKLKK